MKKWIAGVLIVVASAAHGENLEQLFKSPPDSARPYTWWHWQNGNISKEGITKDLESMKAVGIAGFQLFDVNWQTPAGPIVHNTPEFHDMVKFAFSESDRLGLESVSTTRWSLRPEPKDFRELFYQRESKKWNATDTSALLWKPIEFPMDGKMFNWLCRKRKNCCPAM